MSVNVIIKQKSLFKKKLDVKEIIKLVNLDYGVCDDNYRLIQGEIGSHTLLFDRKKLARGIELFMNNNDIMLNLSLPTTKEEIKLFYDIIEKICKALKTKSYTRDEEQTSIENNSKYIEYDENASIGALSDLKEKLEKEEYTNLEIFGVMNPISIGKKEINYIDSKLDKFSILLDKLQEMDVYYAAPKVYQKDGKLIGIYAVCVDNPSVVPLKPYIVLNRIKGINDWYVMLKDGNTVKYEDFINNVEVKEYYDANHVIVTMSDKETDAIIEKYKVILN